MRAFRLSLCTAICLVSVLLCSCTIFDILGIDTHDYEAELKISDLGADSEVYSKLHEIIPIMVQNSPYLYEFNTPSKAAEHYRNGVLCHLLSQNYAKYNGNVELINETKVEYPTYEFTTVIPAVDFEGAVYRYFGGTSSVSNRSTELFTYLDRVDAYVSVGIGVDNSAKINITELYETENTYRCTFTCSMNDITSPGYHLLIMKRDDGTFYIKSLTELKNAA